MNKKKIDDLKIGASSERNELMKITNEKSDKKNKKEKKKKKKEKKKEKEL